MAAKGLSRMSRNSFCQTPPVERAAHWQSGHLQMMPMWMQSMATPEEFWPRKTAVASESYMMPVNCQLCRQPDVQHRDAGQEEHHAVRC